MRIIAFDGNVFVGKSTLLGKLSERIDGMVIPEHSFFVGQVPVDGTHKQCSIQTQEVYLKAESSRVPLIGIGTNLLDRSYLSLVAHTYAVNKLRIVDMRRDFLGMLMSAMENGRVIIPDAYIVVRCGYAIAKSRFVLGCEEKGTDDLYISKEYFSAVDEFNSRWLSVHGGFEIDTSNNYSTKQFDELRTALFSRKKAGLEQLVDNLRECLFM